MAYRSISGTLGNRHYLQILSTPVTAVPATLSLFRLYLSGQPRFAIYRNIVNERSGIQVSLNEGTSPQRQVQFLSTSNNTAIFYAASVEGPLDSEWHFSGGVAGTLSSRIAYYDTTKITDTNSITQSAFDTMIIGGSTAANPVAANGQYAEVALWNVALTDADMASLSKGFKPYRVRPQHLVFYAPLVREIIDPRGGRTINAINAVTIEPHPRVY
jgi:hypothetical protein